MIKVGAVHPADVAEGEGFRVGRPFSLKGDLRYRYEFLSDET